MTAITVEQVEQGLVTVRDRLRPILNYGAEAVVSEAISRLRRSKCEWDEAIRQGRRERRPHPWGFKIDPDSPLKFRDAEVGGLKLRVELSSRAYWDGDPAEQPVELNVLLRIWCLDPHIYFRKHWDSPHLSKCIDPAFGRVMLRVHFDLANKEQPGPKYHVQVGGNSRPEELHWFPEALAVPRLLHTPFDLLLACELVAATFHPSQFEDISREPSWIGSIRVSQQHLLKDYFARALDAVSSGNSVLEELWNVS